MDKLTRWQRGTDRAYEQALDHEQALDLERERFEDEITMDFETFDKWASRYVREETGLQDFLDWAWEKHLAEIRPAYKRGWQE